MERELYESVFDEVPEELTAEEKKAWRKQLTDVVVSSDAFVSNSASFLWLYMFGGADGIPVPLR